MSKPRGEAGLLLVVVLLAVLTIAGISLNWVTDTERVAAALHELWRAARDARLDLEAVHRRLDETWRTHD